MFPCSIKAISNKKLRKQGFFRKCGLKKDRFVLKEAIYLLLVCVCVCLRANHIDVNWLSVKVDQGLPCVRHHIPRSSGKPL